jgi:hypothetical protein
MGLALTTQLSARLAATGLDPSALQLDALIDPMAAEGGMAAPIDGAMRSALALSIESIFVFACVAAVIGLALTLLAPTGRVGALQRREEPTYDTKPSPAD